MNNYYHYQILSLSDKYSMKSLLLLTMLLFASTYILAQDNNGNITSGAGAISDVNVLTTGASTSTSQGGAGGTSSVGNTTTGASTSTIGNTTSTGGSVGNTTTGASTSNAVGGTGGSVGNTTTGASTANAVGGTVGNTTSSSDNANNSTSNVSVTGDTYVAARIPVATAYAPSIAPTAVCALSLSGGAQSVVFGFSMGGSYIDENCELLEQVRAAHAIGARDVAHEMMMEVPAFANAANRITARRAGKHIAATGSNLTQPGIATPAKTEHTDPIIRHRLGLPPL